MSRQSQPTVEQEISKLVEKLSSDFQTKLVKIIDRHTKRVLREQATQLKTATRSTKPTPVRKISEPVKSSYNRARKPQHPVDSSNSDYSSDSH